MRRDKIALVLSALLVISTPGLPSYAAAAEVIGSAGIASGEMRLGALPARAGELGAGLDIFQAAPALPAPLSAPSAAEPAASADLSPDLIQAPNSDDARVSLGELAAHPDAALQKISAMAPADAKQSGALIMESALGLIAAAESDEPAGPEKDAAKPPKPAPKAERPDARRFLAPGAPSPSGPDKNARGFRGKIGGFFRVLSDPAHNWEFWEYSFIRGFITGGVMFFHTALTGIFHGTQWQSAMGYCRAINWGSQAAASLVFGSRLDRMPVNMVFVLTFLGRAALMSLVPWMWNGANHQLTASFVNQFFMMIAATSFLQATGELSGSVFFNHTLGEDKANYNKANTVYNMMIQLFATVGGTAAAWFINQYSDGAAHFLRGEIWSFPVYGAILAISALYCYFNLKLPDDKVVRASKDLHQELQEKRRALDPSLWTRFVKSAAFAAAVIAALLTHAPKEGMRRARALAVARRAELTAHPRYQNTAVARDEEGKPYLVVEVAGDPARMTGVPAKFSNMDVRVVEALDEFEEVREGLRLINEDRFLKVTTLFATPYTIVADAIPFIALPAYLTQVLHMTGDSAISHASGILGAWGAAGLTLASIVMLTMDWAARRKAKDLAGDPKRKSSAMERQGRWSSYLLGAGIMLFGVVFNSPWLGLAAVVYGLINLAYGPAGVIWNSMTQSRLETKYREVMGKIYAAESLYTLLWQVFGSLFLANLAAVVSPATILLVFSAILFLAAVANFLEPSAAYPLDDDAPQGPKP